jgi:WXG100 family type VII secretion target
MQQAQADLSLAYRALTDELHDLENSVEQGLAEWEGEAKAAYEQAKRKWNKLAMHMAETLKQIGVLVGGAHDGYSAAERRNQGIWA